MAEQSPGGGWFSILQGISRGWLLSIPTILVCTIAILLIPHVRGIGFRPELRFWISASTCLVSCICATLWYPQISNLGRPRLRLSVAVVLVAGLLLFVMYEQAGTTLVVQGLPFLLILAAVILFFVPRVNGIDKKTSKIALFALCLFGTIELFGIYQSFVSERTAIHEADGSSIPRSTWDVHHLYLDLKSGARIHYIDEGQGPVLLFLHGNPSYSFQWRDQIERLHGSFRCIAIDYPGFGFSSAPVGFGFTPFEESEAVEEFVDRLQLHNITLVMQDWGGPIGLAFAERRPNLINAVVLGNTWAWPSDVSTPLGKFSLIAGGPVGEFLQTSFNGFTKMGIRNGIKRRLPAETFEAYIAPSAYPAKRGIGAFYAGQINNARDFFENEERSLGVLRDKHALIFWGLRDVGFPPSDIERFKKIFPDHRVVEFPNADHFFLEDEGPTMSVQIAHFLTQPKPLYVPSSDHKLDTARGTRRSLR